MWDTLVFSKVQALLGGRVRLVLIGGAPTDPEVINFGRCVLGARVRRES